MKRVAGFLSVIGVLTFTDGCSSGRLKIEPSKYGLTPETIAYLDEVESSSETMEVLPIPYVAGGKSTSQFVDAADWFLLYTGLEQIGKLKNGYTYQDVGILWPVWVGAETYLYDTDGQTTAARLADSVGLYWPLPMVVLASIFVERSRDVRLSASYSDFGFKLLQLPVARTCLLKISSEGFHLLFIPLWTADRSPPPEAKPSSGSPASAEKTAETSADIEESDSP